MNKKFLRLALTVVMLAASTAAVNAQSILDQVKNAAQAVAGSNSAVSNVIGSLIGTATVQQKDLVGTWSYAEPAIVFESENLLNSAGGALAASSAEKKMNTTLSKYGFSKGKATIVFNSDNTYACTANGKTVKGTYEVQKNTLLLKKGGVTAAKANLKLTNGVLQVSFKTDALLKGVSALGTVAKNNSSITTLTSLAKNFDGMQMGMKFSKK